MIIELFYRQRTLSTVAEKILVDILWIDIDVNCSYTCSVLVQFLFSWFKSCLQMLPRANMLLSVVKQCLMSIRSLTSHFLDLECISSQNYLYAS